MAIRETETITSLDLNFSNGGGSHSASVTTVLRAKDLANSEEELGSLIGSSGSKTTFSNDRIQALMSNFIEVEKTISQNGTTKSISRKYEDVTSLKLKSHCFVVRGSSSHPHDKGLSGGSMGSRMIRNININGSILTGLGRSSPNGQYGSSGKGSEVIIPYFSELPNSGITNKNQRFPFKQPKKFGGVILLGNIYNEESSIAASGEKTSLVYQDKDLKEELSHNLEIVSNYYKFNPDLANYNLKYGYTLSEAKRGFAQAGVSIMGLPESSTNKVLFSESGTLDSVLSTIASKYGYYWFVDPFAAGVVRFVNSSSASQLSITNPLTQPASVQKKYLNASFSENHLQPKIVNAFSSTIEKQEQTFEFSQGQRSTRFHKADFSKELEDLGIDKNLMGVFYGLYLADMFEADTFDALAILATKINDPEIDWGKNWKDATSIKQSTETDFETLNGATLGDRVKEVDKHPLVIKLGKFIKLSGTTKGKNHAKLPSKLGIFGDIKTVFELLTNSYFCSNKFTDWKAKRMQWGSSPMSISGPYLIDEENPTEIKDIDALQSLHTFLKKRGREDNMKIDEFFGKSASAGLGSYGFIGNTPANQKQLGGRGKVDIDYELFNEDNFRFWTHPVSNDKYLVFSQALHDKVKELVLSSRAMFKEVTNGNGEASPNTMKAYYTRAKQPTDLEETEETRQEEEARDRRQAGLDAAAERLSEVNERFDIRYYSLNTNGASGDYLSPITLDTKTGSISDIIALESSNISSRISGAQSLKTSSRTIVGLSLPNQYKITLSSLSIRVGGSGITTTIGESTVKLLPPDEQLIIDGNNKAIRSNASTKRFSASQRTVFGL